MERVTKNRLAATLLLCLTAGLPALAGGARKLPVVTTFQQIQEGDIGRTLHVDKDNPSASDGAAGSSSSPLRTIGEAFRRAVANNRAGIGTRILIHPGIYREQLELTYAGSDNAYKPIIVEAVEPRKAIIAASDVWTGWQATGIAGRYQRNWPYRWGLEPLPAGWDTVTINPLLRRREMVFVDGKPVDQAMSSSELTTNTFFIDESARLIHLQMPAGKVPEASEIEVAVRSAQLTIEKQHNIVLRGLTFRDAATLFQGGGVTILNSTDILIEDCGFYWGNWAGLRINFSDRVTVRRSLASFNGVLGMSGHMIRDLLFEDNETSYNNWRGYRAGFLGWEAGGLKHGRIHRGVYRRHLSRFNHSHGFWLDWDCQDVVIERLCSSENYTNGLFIEANQGPIVMRESTISHNREKGMLAVASQDITLERNLFEDNGTRNISFEGQDTRHVQNFETGLWFDLRHENWTLLDNVIVAPRSDQMIIYANDWDHLLDTLSSGINIVYNPARSAAFQVGSTDLTLDGWRQRTGQDTTTIFADPRQYGVAVESGACGSALPPDRPLPPRGLKAVPAGQ